MGWSTWSPEAWAAVVASAVAVLSLLLSVWMFVAGRKDAKQLEQRQDQQEKEMAEVRARDRADLQFGESWSGLAIESYDVGPFKDAAHVPLENHGRRDGSISAASWVVVDQHRSHLSTETPAFFEPVEEWPGRGNLTVPAGARRLYRLPLSTKARKAIASGQTMHLYLRQVGSSDFVRGELSGSGVRPLPWTDEEITQGQLDAQHGEESAEFYANGQGHGWQ